MLFHGSNVLFEDKIIMNPAHGATEIENHYGVYATDVPAFAFPYMLIDRNKCDWAEFQDKKGNVFIRFESKEHPVLDYGYLYFLDSYAFTALTPRQFISYQDVPFLFSAKIYLAPFYEKEKNDTIKVKKSFNEYCFEFSFLVKELIDLLKEKAEEEQVKAFLNLLKVVVPIHQFYIDLYHGIFHALRVSAIALILAYLHNDRMPVDRINEIALAAYLHDIGRLVGNRLISHEINSVEYLKNSNLPMTAFGYDSILLHNQYKGEMVDDGEKLILRDADIIDRLRFQNGNIDLDYLTFKQSIDLYNELIKTNKYKKIYNRNKKMKSFQPIIKLTNLCNLNCEYCYYKSTLKDSKQVPFMSDEVWERLVDKTVEYNVKNGCYSFDFCLHGGEPSLYPIERLKKNLDYIDKVVVNYPEVHYSISFQSNGQHFSDELISLIKEKNINIGISIDGPDEINRIGRTSESNCNVTKKALDTIKKLIDAKVKFGVLTVVTNHHKGKAKDVYDFYKENGIHSVGILRCFGDLEKVDNDILADFLIELFDLYFYGDYKLSIREFEFAIKRVLGGKIGFVCNMCGRKRCGEFLTISTSGDVFFCDNDISSATAYGNILHDEVEEIYANPIFLEKISETRRPLEKCEKCEVFHICGSGCHRNDIDSENYFCEAYKQVYNHIEKCVINKLKEMDLNERR